MRYSTLVEQYFPVSTTLQHVHAALWQSNASMNIDKWRDVTLLHFQFSPCSGDTEEESEGEELRKAAKAYSAANKQAKSQPDVIVLDDSSDDEPPRPQPAAHRLPAQLNHVSSPHSHSHSHSSSRLQHSSQPSAGQSPGSAGNYSHTILSQPGSWAQGSSASRQLPSSFQSKASNAAKPSSNGLRIKLNTNVARHQQQQPVSQGAVHHHTTNGHAHASLHPADPAMSAARLAAAVTLREPTSRHGAGPSNLGAKRKHYELDGQYGAYSQASAQAAGMSMSDHMQQAANRASGSRLPPYPETTVSYGSRGSGSYSQAPPLQGGESSQPQSQSAYQPPNPFSSGWRHQQPPGASAYAPPLSSAAYASGMPASPPYASGNGNLQSHQGVDAARNPAYLHGMTQYGSEASQWNAQPLADGEL